MDKIIEILTAIGIPYAYHHFSEKEVVDPPFICFLCPNSTNFSADGKAYFKKGNVRVELYTDKKDPSKESQVEAVLDSNDIFYDKSEVWIESEKLYETIYEFEMEA